MLKPSLLLFIVSLVALASGFYYLRFRKKDFEKWAFAMKRAYYIGLVIAFLIVVWGGVSIIVTGGLR